ncbi:unnamed protein product [Bursaphelenchus xylophilus]|uniref:(pine wood nematode) hypothetical protein n=1 Tax=Bursaphelenchus xylophilus TaxID=6326 RepID=A0A1I7RLG8_BURXY|nr:unnamed protein product [Bursaphelenchus xylophilus]CAG9082998.1 unnamed protein product [Bursaphelenchus xylophilus]
MKQSTQESSLTVCQLFPSGSQAFRRNEFVFWSFASISRWGNCCNGFMVVGSWQSSRRSTSDTVDVNLGQGMEKPSLSRLERRKNHENTTRLCMICGTYTPLGQCLIYPKARRREFDEALNLPKHISDALPTSCCICIRHFDDEDVIAVRSDAHAKINPDAVPCKKMDGVFLTALRELDPLEFLSKSEINPVSLVKQKLGLDRHTKYVQPLDRAVEITEENYQPEELSEGKSLLASLFEEGDTCRMSVSSEEKDSNPLSLVSLFKSTEDGNTSIDLSDILNISGHSPDTENQIKKRKCYSISTKLEAIQYAKDHTTFLAAEKYGVDRKCIRDWMLKEKELKKCTGDQKRIKGAGRPPRAGRNGSVPKNEQEKEELVDDNVLAKLLSEIQKNVKAEESKPNMNLTATKKKTEAPPLLERMDDEEDGGDNEPPPLIAANSNTSSYALRPKRSQPMTNNIPQLKKIPRTSSAFQIPSTSNVSDAELIKQLRIQLTEKNTEIHLLKKKLVATEELLSFYMNTSTPELESDNSPLTKSNENNNKIQSNQALKIGNQLISWKAAKAPTEEPQATAMVVECNQDSLQQHLSSITRTESSDSSEDPSNE